MALGVGLALTIALVGIAIFLAWQRFGARRPAVDEGARRQFALALDEGVTRTFVGALYFGRLRPDVTRADFDHHGAMAGSPARGEALTFALTDHARLAISRGPSPDVATPNPAQLPFRLWGKPGLMPRVQGAAEAFPGSPYLEEANAGPQSESGEQLVLLHFVAPDGPLTVWVEAAGAAAIEEWVVGDSSAPGASA